MEWVRDFGLAPHSLTDFGGDRFAWAFTVQGQPFSTVVAQRCADFTYLAIQATVTVAEDHREALRNLGPDERETFLYDLRLSLRDRQIGHGLAFSPEAPGEPVSVVIGSNLVDEQVTRAAWFARNHAIQNGASLVALMFQKMAHRKCWP